MSFPPQSIQLTGPVGVTSQSDTFPTHIDTLGRGGLRSVNSVADLSEIPAARRSFGMEVFCIQENEKYRLANVGMGGDSDDLDNDSNWAVVGEGGGGSPGDGVVLYGSREVFADPVLSGQVVLDDNFSNTFIRSIDYTIQVEANDRVQISKIHCIHNQVEPFYTEQGLIFNDVELASYSLGIISNKLTLTATVLQSGINKFTVKYEAITFYNPTPPI